MADSGPWYQALIRVPEALSDSASALLFDLGSTGLEVRDGPDSGTTLLVAYFGPQSAADTLRGAIGAGLTQLEPAVANTEVLLEPVQQVDWSAGWRDHFRPVRVTRRILVCPPWEVLPDPPDGFTIVIEPKMAFGTGHHETTCLALKGLQAHVASGHRVLDAGCGSGILSIAAIKLGASLVTSVDTDPLAIESSLENAALNGTDASTQVRLGSVVDAPGRYDVVAANIISSALIPILSDIAERLVPGGLALLGGVLSNESAAFRGSAELAGLSLEEEDVAGEWASFTATVDERERRGR